MRFTWGTARTPLPQAPERQSGTVGRPATTVSSFAPRKNAPFRGAKGDLEGEGKERSATLAGGRRGFRLSGGLGPRASRASLRVGSRSDSRSDLGIAGARILSAGCAPAADLRR